TGLLVEPVGTDRALVPAEDLAGGVDQAAAGMDREIGRVVDAVALRQRREATVLLIEGQHRDALAPGALEIGGVAVEAADEREDLGHHGSSSFLLAPSGAHSHRTLTAMLGLGQRVAYQ